MLTTPSEPLAKLREPFAAHHISKLPKPTKAQTDAVKDNFKAGIRCQVCGSWHHPDVIHLDYVGHAALTDRLLDTDIAWSWEPLAFRDGLPAFDQTGGLWIKLNVCGIERLGYGHAAAKPNMDPGAREKEVIGDALRNAAMRFGAALDLWHKGELHPEEEAPAPAPRIKGREQGAPHPDADFPGAEGSLGRTAYAVKESGEGERFNELIAEIESLTTMVEVGMFLKERTAEIKTLPGSWRKLLREALDEQKHAIAQQSPQLDGERVDA